MKKKIAFIGLIAMMAMASTVTAAEITTSDGVLSITTPGDEWEVKEDPDAWFAISDGTSTITVDHLGNGEDLPTVDVAGEEYEAVYQAFVSTRNEVFIVKGLAATQEELEEIMKTIGTIKVLKYDTKTAVQKEEKTAENTAPAATAAAAPAATAENGIRQLNATYYVAADALNVRGGYTTNDAVIGTVYRGEPVTVTGAVTKDGADLGWYQIQYNGQTGYISASYLSQQNPGQDTAGNTAAEGQSEANMEQCQYCGKWFVVGDEYRNHLLGHSMEGLDSHEDMEQCQYCGQWFVVGDEYRNHLLGHSMEGLDSHEGMEQCQYCGEWFDPTDDAYREHLLGHTMEGMSTDN